MTRSPFVVVVLGSLGLAHAQRDDPPLRTVPLPRSEPAVARPNVLFVSIDDLNDWIEPLGGHPDARTPNLTRMARASVCFERAYCASPSCNPSRVAVMTGRAPYRSGVYSNYQDWREVLSDAQTIGAYLREHGYHSSGAGKIFHYHMIDPRCWDEYWPSQEQNMPREVMPDLARSRLPELPDGQRPRTMNMPEFRHMYRMFDWFPLAADDAQMGDSRSVDHVVGQLKKKRDRPFFVACGIYRPHLPWYVPKKYFDMFPVDEIRLPKIKAGDLEDLSPRAIEIAHRGGNYHQHVLAAGEWRAAVQGYLASIAFADAMLGRLLDALEASEHAKNTIVVVWSDHGWQLGEKEHWRKFGLWENTLRSVLMIRVPKGTPALPDGSADGTACSRIVSLQDIYPTLVDLCGLPVKPDIDGRSLRPLLRDPKADWPHPAISTYDFDEFSVRTERWRYTRYIDGSEELYDHAADREEWNNLAAGAAYAAIKAELRAHVPARPAPLVKTSYRLQLHHFPPFRSRAEYDEWLKSGKDTQALIQKYWQ